MLNWINFFTFSLLLTFAIIAKIESQETDLVDLIIQVKDYFKAHSAILVRNYVDGNIVEETAALDLQRLLSKNYVFSDFIQLENLTDAIDRYHKKIVLPFYVIILKTSEDFEMLANAMHLRGVSFASLVIFSTDNETLMSFCTRPEFNYFNLKFNAKMLVFCQDEDVPIREWYSVFSNKTEVGDIAYWKDKNFEKTTNKSLYERRNSLKGISLRATDVKNETTIKDDYSAGYFIQILDIISQRGNFVVDRQPMEDYYGVYNPETRKWNGIIEKLANNETDLGLGEMTITTNRLRVVDFSKPIISSRAYYYIKKPNATILPWNVYYLAFGKIRERISLVTLLSLVPFLIAWIKIENMKAINKKERRMNFIRNILDCYLEVWTIFCRMPLTNFPETTSLRLAYFSLKILTLFIFAIYSAVLTSYLSHLQPMLPFNSVDGLVQDGSYKILIIKGTNFVEIFENSTDDKINELKKFLLDNEDLPVYIADAFEKVCYDGKFVLFLDRYNMFNNQTSSNCELVDFDQADLMNMAFAFSKNSPYVGFFDHHIQKLKRGGILKRLEELNIRSDKSNQPIYDAISIYNAIPIFSILGAGMILSLIILMCEYTVYYAPFHKFITAHKKSKIKKLQLSTQRTKSINQQTRGRNDPPILHPFTN